MRISCEWLCISCRENSYIRNGWAGDISAPSLGDVYYGNNSSANHAASANNAASANDADETIIPEWKKIENDFASEDELQTREALLIGRFFRPIL